MKRLAKHLGLYLILMVILVSLFNGVFWNSKPQMPKMSYSQLMTDLRDGTVKSLTLHDRVASGEKKDGTAFETVIPGTEPLATEALSKGVDVTVEPPERSPWYWDMIYAFLPTLLIIGVWVYMLRGMGGAGSKMNEFSKSKAKLFLDQKPPATYDDVAGCDEAKEELQEVVEFLRAPEKFTKLGARVPRGVLLLGPPGTGKTLLARATAGEAQVPFFSTTGSDFLEMFVGVGAARVRDLFEQARKRQPCIVFIDEIDAVGRQRGAGLGGGHDEREQTLNQLLVEMDGFDDKGGIILMAATNRPDVLDPALLRPGRFDRHVVVDAPDVKGREAILRVHMKGKHLAPDVDPAKLAAGTPGFVGADLANLVNEAALLAARAGKDQITMHEFEEGIERAIAGPERRSRVVSPKEREIIAYHEVGHALVAHYLPGSDPVHKITIIPRGHAALGYTLQLPREDKFLSSKIELENQICTLLAGRAAEALKFGDENVTTGASNDLQRATQIARDIVTQYGMSDLGLVVLGKPKHQVFLGRDLAEDRNYSDRMALAIDEEVKKLIDRCFERVKSILIEHRDAWEAITRRLLEVETIQEEEFLRFLGEAPAEPADAPAQERAEDESLVQAESEAPAPADAEGSSEGDSTAEGKPELEGPSEVKGEGADTDQD